MVKLVTERIAFQIRPCHLYNDEFYECERPKGRFHQLFIYGDYLDCNQWKTDFQLCKRWTEQNDLAARVCKLQFLINNKYSSLCLIHLLFVGRIDCK